MAHLQFQRLQLKGLHWSRKYWKEGLLLLALLLWAAVVLAVQLARPSDGAMHEALTGSKLSTREGDEGDERPRLSTVGKHRGKNGGAREEEMDARSREGGRTEHGGHHQAGKGGAVGGGGNHAHAQVEEVKAGVIMGDAGTCVREMAAIHRCANARWTNCTAATYWRCLQSLGAAPASYTALVDGRHGKFLVNVNDMYIGASLYTYGEWSEEEVLVMSGGLSSSSLVIDVGANIGAIAVPLARRLPHGTVICYEPQRIVSQLLAANVQLNGLDNVQVRVAAAAIPGQERTVPIPEVNPHNVHNFGGFSVNQHAPHQGGHVGGGGDKGRPAGWAEVPVEAIDDLGLGRLDLLKVDAQGMEAEVLKGAARTIGKFLPSIYMEYESQSRELYHLVRSLGPYKCYHHAPPLYNARNFRGERFNLFGEMRSFNVYCVARPEAIVPEWLLERDLERVQLPRDRKSVV